MKKTNSEFVVATVPVFRFFNVKAGARELAENLVTLKVLVNQYDRVTADLPLDEFKDAHPEKDFWTATPEDFEGVVNGEDLADVLETRGNALKVKRAIDDLPVTMEDFNALSNADKRFILIEVHKNVPSISIPAELLPETFDLTSPVEKFFKSGNKKEAQNQFRAMLYKIIGQGGELFDGVALTRSEIKCEDIIQTLATFGGKATRKENKKSGELGNYDWVRKYSNKGTQRAALTTLAGVMLESRKDSVCKVVRG